MNFERIPASIDQLHHEWGPRVQENGRTRFRVFAPKATSVEMDLMPAKFANQWMTIHTNESHISDIPPLGQFRDSIQRHSLSNCGKGWFETELPDIEQGTLYQYRVDGGSPRPDPASRFQPLGVHSWSQVYTGEEFQWTDSQWKGIPKTNLVIYELHVGAFTRAGTYLAAIDRLDELVELGITAIELMPIAQCAGRWNWGYDGVNFFAPAFAFGTPDELRKFIDTAHRKGLAVFLDVVYNHVGPEGNYFRDFGDYISPHRNTVWGDSFNIDLKHDAYSTKSDSHGLDDPTVQSIREFLVANVTYWLDQFHFDGLRLDAIHCLTDDSTTHIVNWISRAFTEFANKREPEFHLIAESNVYDSEMLTPIDQSGYGFDSLWCDDFLHSVFAIVRPGEDMSHRSYQPNEDLNTTLQRGYVYEGSLHEQRQRYSLAERPEVADLPSLIIAIQNHDFIGNHPLAKRFHQLTSLDLQRSAAALMLLFPATPMLFMGEEYATDSPFYFFTDFSDEDIRDALLDGRKREYPQHDWTGGISPIEESAFTESYVGERQQCDTLNWYRQCLALRSRLRAEGLLNANCMTAHYESQLHVAKIKYQAPHNPNINVTLHTRLHPANKPVPNVSLINSPELNNLLSQNADVSADSIHLKAAGVVVLSENFKSC